MPEYVVEDLQTEEQVDSFEADGLIEAANLALLNMCQRISFQYSTEIGDRSNVYISIKLPYGEVYRYEVGEVGK